MWKARLICDYRNSPLVLAPSTSCKGKRGSYKDFKKISLVACHDPKVGRELRTYRKSNRHSDDCYDNKSGAKKGSVTGKTATLHKLYQRYLRLPYRDTSHVKKIEVVISSRWRKSWQKISRVPCLPWILKIMIRKDPGDKSCCNNPTISTNKTWLIMVTSTKPNATEVCNHTRDWKERPSHGMPASRRIPSLAGR